MYTDKVPTLRELTNDDVLLGRGFPAIENEGNVRFRELVRSRSAEYHAAYRRHTKDSIARDVVNTIHRRNGRFLTQLDNASNIKGLLIPAGARIWTEADEAAVLIKAKQALRDHSDDSKESSRIHIRRRPAEGSGNLVLEWVVPAASHSSEQAEAPGATSSSSTSAWGLSHPPSVTAIPAASSNTHQISNLHSFRPSSSQQRSFLHEESSNTGSLRIHGRDEATAPALLTTVARQQQLQQSMFLPGGQFNSHSCSPSTNSQIALRHIFEDRHGHGIVAGREANIPIGLAMLLQNTTDASLASLQSMYATHQSNMTMSSDRGLPSSQGVLSSTSSNSMNSSQPTSGGRSVKTSGSRASTAISRALRKASSETHLQEEGDLLLCDLEVNLLNVLCSFGLPLWVKDSSESSFDPSATTREEGSTEFGWTDLGKHFLATCRSTVSAVTETTNLFTDLRTLARITVFLVGRCVKSTKLVDTRATAASTAASSCSTRFGGMVASLTQCKSK